MRCAVDGCKPVFSLISFNEMASSLDAKTSIKEKSRSMTCMVGTTGVGASAFLMGLNLGLMKAKGLPLEDFAKFYFTR